MNAGLRAVPAVGNLGGTGIGFRRGLLGLWWGDSRTVAGVGYFCHMVGEEGVVGSFGLVDIGRPVPLDGDGVHLWHRWVSSDCIVDKSWRWHGDYGNVEVSVGGKRIGVAGWLTLGDAVVVDDDIAG